MLVFKYLFVIRDTIENVPVCAGRLSAHQFTSAMNAQAGRFCLGAGMKAFFTKEEVLALPWVKNPCGIRDKGAVYRIVEKQTGELLYIGQAANVGHRLCPSVHPIYRVELHDVYILFEQKKDERHYMESRFIEILKPSINIRRGIMPDMSFELKREYYNHVFEKKA